MAKKKTTVHSTVWVVAVSQPHSKSWPVTASRMPAKASDRGNERELTSRRERWSRGYRIRRKCKDVHIPYDRRDNACRGLRIR